VFHIVSALQVNTPKFCTHFFSPHNCQLDNTKRWLASIRPLAIPKDVNETVLLFQHKKTEKSGGIFLSIVPRFSQEHCILEGSHVSPICLSGKSSCRWRWVWRPGGMEPTGEKRNSRRKICSSATLCSTYFTWIDLGSNAGPRGDRLATNRPSHCTTDIETQFNHNYV